MQPYSDPSLFRKKIPRSSCETTPHNIEALASDQRHHNDRVLRFIGWVCRPVRTTLRDRPQYHTPWFHPSFLIPPNPRFILLASWSNPLSVVHVTRLAMSWSWKSLTCFLLSWLGRDADISKVFRKETAEQHRNQRKDGAWGLRMITTGGVKWVDT